MWRVMLLPREVYGPGMAVVDVDMQTPMMTWRGFSWQTELEGIVHDNGSLVKSIRNDIRSWPRRPAITIVVGDKSSGKFRELAARGAHDLMTRMRRMRFSCQAAVFSLACIPDGQPVPRG